MRNKICSLLLLIILSSGYIHAQDYLISFSGTGASTVVESVKVENITQGTEKTLAGTDVLHLVSVVTGIDQIGGDKRDKILFSPNPVTGNAKMKFFLPSSGETTITVYDITGRKIFGKQDNLSAGEHIYSIEGFESGIWFVNVSKGGYSSTGRLISNESQKGEMKMTYENSVPSEKKTDESKGVQSEVEMQYNANDRLIFTALGGESLATVSFIPSSTSTITFEFYPCKDGDNNKYSTVKIGTQIWMATNLKTTKFNGGESIPLVTDNAAWMAIRYEPAYCWYDNDASTYKNYFGALYNFWVISAGNLCPTGWHVPTFDEFSLLRDYLIKNGFNYDNSVVGDGVGKSLASTAMIFFLPPPSAPSIVWEFTNDDGCVGNTDFPLKRNATGFSALPSGFRGNGFSGINRKAYWWSSTDFDMTMGRYTDLQTDWETFGAGSTYKWVGYSVRCLKDF